MPSTSDLEQDVYPPRVKRIRFADKTYTSYGENVYVSSLKRIRLGHETYTFCPHEVYVLPSQLPPAPSEHPATPPSALSFCRELRRFVAEKAYLRGASQEGKCLSSEVSRERLRAVRNLSAYGARCERQTPCLTREDVSSHLKIKGMTTQATSTSTEELASSSRTIYSTEHPEGQLRRMDGTLLRLYPATSLPAPLTPEARTEATELFRQSLSLLWRYRERILRIAECSSLP